MLTPDNLTPKITPKSEGAFPVKGQEGTISGTPNVRKKFKEIYEGKGEGILPDEGTLSEEEELPSSNSIPGQTVVKLVEKDQSEPFSGSLFELSAAQAKILKKPATTPLTPPSSMGEVPLVVKQQPKLGKSPIALSMENKKMAVRSEFPQEHVDLSGVDQGAVQTFSPSPSENSDELTGVVQTVSMDQVADLAKPATPPHPAQTLFHSTQVEVPVDVAQLEKPVGVTQPVHGDQNPQAVDFVSGNTPQFVGGQKIVDLPQEKSPIALPVEKQPIVPQMTQVKDSLKLRHPEVSQLFDSNEVDFDDGDVKPYSHKENVDTSYLPASGIGIPEMTQPQPLSGAFVAPLTPPIQTPELADLSKAEFQPRSRVQEIQKIIDMIVDKVYTLQVSGKTDTVIVLKNIPMFENVNIKVTSFSSARGEFNITFSNMTQHAKQILDAHLIQSPLQLALEQKIPGIVIHMVTTTTINENIPFTSSSETSSQSKYGKNEGGTSDQFGRGQKRQR